MIYHKYKAKPTTIDNIRFSSNREANYYAELLLRIRAGEVLFFLRQVPFSLPGGVTYRVDFAEFWSNGEVHFTDVKGMRLRSYIDKKKMVEALYPVTIEEA